MSERFRLVLGAFDGGLEEADLLARLADVILDYVADGHHVRDAAGACGAHMANQARTHQDHAGQKRFAETAPRDGAV